MLLETATEIRADFQIDVIRTPDGSLNRQPRPPICRTRLCFDRAEELQIECLDARADVGRSVHGATRARAELLARCEIHASPGNDPGAKPWIIKPSRFL